jgi:hypothetical protein
MAPLEWSSTRNIGHLDSGIDAYVAKLTDTNTLRSCLSWQPEKDLVGPGAPHQVLLSKSSGSSLVPAPAAPVASALSLCFGCRKGHEAAKGHYPRREVLPYPSLHLFHRLDFARLPGLVEPRFQGTIKPQDHKPTFACDCLRPISLKVCGRIGSEIGIY